MNAELGRASTAGRAPISSTAFLAPVEPGSLEVSANEVLCLYVLHGKKLGASKEIVQIPSPKTQTQSDIYIYLYSP